MTAGLPGGDVSPYLSCARGTWRLDVREPTLDAETPAVNTLISLMRSTVGLAALRFAPPRHPVLTSG